MGGVSKCSAHISETITTCFHSFTEAFPLTAFLFRSCSIFCGKVDASSSVGLHGERTSLAPQLARQPATYLELIIRNVDFAEQINNHSHLSPSADLLTGKLTLSEHKSSTHKTSQIIAHHLFKCTFFWPCVM